jgi:hypothetical protein
MPIDHFLARRAKWRDLSLSSQYGFLRSFESRMFCRSLPAAAIDNPPTAAAAASLQQKMARP